MRKAALAVHPPAHCELRFPDDKAKIAQLTQDEKAEWYAHQFRRNPGEYPTELTTREFLRFWRWRYYFPIRMKRFFVRIKTFQIFKHYDHITVMKEKLKKHAI